MKMKWSYSQAKQFQRCPRQWYYKTQVANAVTKDPLRRRAFLLSKLDSVWAWRGKIVDSVLSTQLVSDLSQKRIPRENELQTAARNLFDAQLQYARTSGIRQKDLVISKIGPEFAALHGIETGQPPTDEELQQAAQDIQQAIGHLMRNQELLNTLRGAQRLVAQRSLQFKLPGLHGDLLNVSATPDLIAFRRDAPPLIIDWKVKFFSRNDAREQLRVYGYALAVTPPHVDFPTRQSPFGPKLSTDRRAELLEYQLLDDVQRYYPFDEAEMVDVEDFIQVSAHRMAQVMRASEPLDLQTVPVTHHAETCEGCTFKTMCWEETDVNA